MIEKLNNPFRRILKVSANSPALVVKFSIKEKFDIQLLKECNEIAEQIVALNLSGMPVDDKVFPILAGFENLEKILIDAEVTTHSDLTKNIANEYFRFEYPSIVNRFEIDENSIL